MKKQKIVTIGGGTGSFVLLSGLKKLPVDLSAIVSMADDGGSGGVLRDELGVLPPGDIRQCLIALSQSSETLRQLFNYRYSSGSLNGHNFGNIFVSTLEKMTGNIDEAIKQAGIILRIKGKILPVTLSKLRLYAIFHSGQIIKGEDRIDYANLNGLKKIELKPRAVINPEASRAILQADKIIINPGDIFTSIIPCLLVKGVPEAIKKSKAKKIYICNLMTKAGQTNGYTVCDFLEEISKYLGREAVRYIIYNTEIIKDPLLIKRYLKNKENFVRLGNKEKWKGKEFIGKPLLSRKLFEKPRGDKLRRTIIRHDSDKIAKIIFKL